MKWLLVIIGTQFGHPVALVVTDFSSRTHCAEHAAILKGNMPSTRDTITAAICLPEIRTPTVRGK